jgi:FMN phosphatase YigB (HAD superfamily)/sugar phosphate isomerase/epimerase
MPNPNIEAILFDIGGTWRHSYKFPEPIMANILEIMNLAGLEGSPQEWLEKFNERYRYYYQWGTMTLLELSEPDLWSKWLLPEVPSERIKPIAVKLNKLWRDAKSEKILMKDTTQTVKELSRRGYRLGVISNTSSSSEVPRLLKEMGVADLVETVVLTNKLGKRKPHPSPFLIATDALGITPAQAAYIGNRPSRDVVGAREAGIAEVVIINLPGKEPEIERVPQKPDHTIQNLSELLDIYPPRERQSKKNYSRRNTSPLYDCAVSTMWGIDQYPNFNDFFHKCREIGFARFELNHQIKPERMAEIDFNLFHINSLHEPCPATLSIPEMDQRDWMISSLDEEKRAIAVTTAKQTIDKAVELGCRYVVIHAGTTRADRKKEKLLRNLYETGQADTDEFKSLRNDYMLERSPMAAPHLDATIKSLIEIGAYAFKSGIAIGLENRYHYYDIPLIDEMQLLLDLYEDYRWGFIYDVGHAQALDRLGFFKHEDWLIRYGSRMIGVHLHDVVGITDHQSPGSGEVDFAMVAKYLPDSAFRVLEVNPSLTPQQIQAGLEFLAGSGCIDKY